MHLCRRNLPVVAEGVETSALAHRLRLAGCRIAQGFGFSKALPSAEFDRWVRRLAGDVA